MPHRKDLLQKLAHHVSSNEDEEASRILMTDFVKNNEDCFHRENLEGHVTASAWIVNKHRDMVLLMHHKKLGFWMQPGGHADGDSDVLNVATKEMQEETGLNLKLASEHVFDIDVHTIPEHKGVPEHQHYDVRFLFEGDEHKDIPVQNHESHGVQWFSLEEAYDATGDESIHRMLAKTLKISKVRQI